MNSLLFHTFRQFSIILSAFRIRLFNPYLVGLILVNLALSGCKKEEECDGSCIEVSGRVGSEQNSAVPLIGAIVQLSSIGNGSSFFPAPVISIQQVRSSSDGAYSIKFVPTTEMQKRGNYRLLFWKEGYGRDTSSQADYTNLALFPGGHYEKNLHLIRPGGHLRILIGGFSGGSAVNSTYTIVETGRGGAGYFGIGSQPLLYATGTNQVIGSSNITDVTCKTAANQYAFVQIYKMKAGVRTTIRDSIYCPVNQIVTYTHAF